MSLVKLCKQKKRCSTISICYSLVTLSPKATCHSLDLPLVKCYPCLVTQRQNPKNCTKLSTFIKFTSTTFGQELYISSVKFRTNGSLSVFFVLSNFHTIKIFLIHPQASLCEKYDIKLNRKNPIGKHTSALGGNHRHIITCCMYKYTIIKCQVPEAVNKNNKKTKTKNDNNKYIRQKSNGKQKC